jgi:hypothetical protein
VNGINRIRSQIASLPSGISGLWFVPSSAEKEEAEAQAESRRRLEPGYEREKVTPVCPGPTP